MGLDRQTRRFERFRRHGDAAALGAVFDALAPRLLRLALHLTGDPARAEDAVQETFLVAIERRDDFDATRRLEPWLVGICARIARRRRRADAAGELPELVGGADPAELAGDREAAEALERAVEALPEPYCTALRLRLVHGLSPAEIAVALGLGPATVRSHLSRGLERLRGRLPTALLGSLALIASPSRGLAAVRADVLAGAAALAPTTGVPTLLSSLLVMKKSTVLPAVFVLALVGAVAWFAGSGPRTPPASAAEPEALSTATGPEGGDVGDRAVAPERAPVDEAQVATPAGGVAVEPATWTVALAGEGQPYGGATGILRSRAEERLVEFDSAGVWSSGPLPPGSWALWLGFNGLRADLAPGERRSDTHEVGGGLELDLVVLDPEGRPFPGATVAARRGFGDSMVVGRTDFDGRFRSGGFSSQTDIVVWAAGHGRPAAFELPSLERGLVERTVTLLPDGVDLVGRVVDEAGRPVVGAEVFLGPGRTWRAVGSGRLRTFTDRDGAFALPGLAPAGSGGFPTAREFGSIDYLTAVVPGEAWGRSESFVLAPGLGPVDLVLTRGGVVLGRVTDASGEPVVGARIEDVLGSSFLAVDSDELGRFELAGIPLGVPIDLQCLIWPQQLGRQRRTVTLEPDEELVWDIRLPVGAAISGVVGRVDGVAVERGQINVRREPDVTADRVAGSAWIDGDGRFELRLPVGLERGYLFVRLAGYNSSDLTQGPFAVEAGDTDVEILLEDPARIGATLVLDVVDEQGQPFVGATVTLCRMHLDGGASFTDLAPDPITARAERVGLTPGLWGVAIDAAGRAQRIVAHRELDAGERWVLGAVEIGPPGDPPADWGEQTGELFRVTRAHFESDGAAFEPMRVLQLGDG